ncbi:Tn3 family transposase [Deinococcus arcticus]|uniref:Tn3 family transposase n=1 Tax=Deinococcus arcticus TaxID=2136176 RepID=UPI0022B8E140|nr:Tn3 family transposase [Deinococcus arcticus]
MLRYVQDEGYRHRIQRQVNRGGLRHSVARAVFHGGKGELGQKYREGMEDQLEALGLVVNAMVLWNTRYLALAVEDIRQAGQLCDEAEVARLSPLLSEHGNILGKYDFRSQLKSLEANCASSATRHRWTLTCTWPKFLRGSFCSQSHARPTRSGRRGPQKTLSDPSAGCGRGGRAGLEQAAPDHGPGT